MADEKYRGTDSIRAEITELTEVYVSAYGFRMFNATVFPNSSLFKDKNGVSKIYITLTPENQWIEKEKDQRYIDLDDATVFLSPDRNFYTFENEDEFSENRTTYRLKTPKKNFTGKYETYAYREVVNGLTSFSVSDYLDRSLILNNFDNDSVFVSTEDLSVDLTIYHAGLVAIEGGKASLQLSGEWNLINHYHEVLYRHPLKTYTSIDVFTPESFHGQYEDGWFRSSGVTKAIEEALQASFADFFTSKRTHYFLDKKNPLYEQTRKANQELPVIHLRNTAASPAKVSLEQNLESTVLLSDKDNSSFGSGSIISEDGYILTSYHVVDEMESIFVTLNSGKKFKAVLKRCDKNLDVALLKIDCTSCKPISFEAGYHVGDEVFDIGTPLDIEHFNSVFSGIISAARTIHGRPYIQTSSVSLSGMSGGPLINSSGRQIGVRVWGLVDPDGDDIYGFCFYIPISEAFKSLNMDSSIVQ